MNDYLDESELFKPVKPAKVNKDGYLDESGLFPEATRAKVEARSFGGELLTTPIRGTVEAAETGLRALRMGTDTPGKEEGFIDEWAAKGIKKIEEAKGNYAILQPKYEGGVKGAISQGVQSVITSLEAGIPGAVAGAAVASAVPVPGVSQALGAIIGFGLSAGTTFGLAEYDRTIQDADAQGISRDKSEAVAIRKGLYEGGFEFLGDVLSGLTMGIAKPLTTVGKETLETGIREMFKVGWKQQFKRYAGVVGIETGSELITGGAQAEEDFRLGLGNQRFWGGVQDAFGPAFVASLIFGGIGAGTTAVQRRSIRVALENPEASVASRAKAVNEVRRTIEDVNPELAQTWERNALQAIYNKEPIPLDRALKDSEIQDDVTVDPVDQKISSILAPLDERFGLSRSELMGRQSATVAPPTDDPRMAEEWANQTEAAQQYNQQRNVLGATPDQVAPASQTNAGQADPKGNLDLVSATVDKIRNATAEQLEEMAAKMPTAIKENPEFKQYEQTFRQEFYARRRQLAGAPEQQVVAGINEQLAGKKESESAQSYRESTNGRISTQNETDGNRNQDLYPPVGDSNLEDRDAARVRDVREVGTVDSGGQGESIATQGKREPARPVGASPPPSAAISQVVDPALQQDAQGVTNGQLRGTEETLRADDGGAVGGVPVSARAEGVGGGETARADVSPKEYGPIRVGDRLERKDGTLWDVTLSAGGRAVIKQVGNSKTGDLPKSHIRRNYKRVDKNAPTPKPAPATTQPSPATAGAKPSKRPSEDRYFEALTNGVEPEGLNLNEQGTFAKLKRVYDEGMISAPKDVTRYSDMLHGDRNTKLFFKNIEQFKAEKLAEDAAGDNVTPTEQAAQPTPEPATAPERGEGIGANKEDHRFTADLNLPTLELMVDRLKSVNRQIEDLEASEPRRNDINTRTKRDEKFKKLTARRDALSEAITKARRGEFEFHQKPEGPTKAESQRQKRDEKQAQILATEKADRERLAGVIAWIDDKFSDANINDYNKLTLARRIDTGDKKQVPVMDWRWTDAVKRLDALNEDGTVDFDKIAEAYRDTPTVTENATAQSGIDHTRIKPNDTIKFNRGGRDYTEAVMKVMPQGDGPLAGTYQVDSFGIKHIKPEEVIAVKHRDGTKQEAGRKNEQGNAEIKQQQRDDANSQAGRNAVSATPEPPPNADVAEQKRGSLPEYAKKAGIKTWQQAQKKGVTSYIETAKQHADKITKKAANWIYGDPSKFSDSLAEEMVRQVVMTGGRDSAYNALYLRYSQKANGADPGVKERNEAIAQGFREVLGEKAKGADKNAQLSTSLHPSERADIEAELAKALGGKFRVNRLLKTVGIIETQEEARRIAEGGKLSAAFHGSPHDWPAERLVEYKDGRRGHIVGAPGVLPVIPDGAKVIKNFPHGRAQSGKIGTGEGAQAYGYGLYFAGRKDVAEWYREKLSNRPVNRDGGNGRIETLEKFFNSLSPQEYKKVDELLFITNSHGFTRDELMEDFSGHDPSDHDAWYSELMDSSFRDKLLSFSRERGRLYEVELAPAETDYLLWDRPLSEQSEKVRKALKKSLPSHEAAQKILEKGEALAEKAMVSGDVYGPEYKAFNDFVNSTEYGLAQLTNKGERNSGKSVYQKFTDVLKTDSAASEYLHSLGIRGIKYLDGSSRGKGDGAYNYVIFDEADIEIKAKYSQDGNIQGLYINGKAYLVRDGIAKGQAFPVLLHELGEHANHLGFAKDTEYQSILKAVERLKDRKGSTGQAIRAAMARAERAGTKPEHMASETLAYLVEAKANAEIGIVKRILNFFKKWLFKAGMLNADRFTAEDLVLFAKAAVRAETGGGVIGDAMMSLREKFGPVDVESASFKRWFEGSKVVDEDGKPLVVYHHTTADFEAFAYSGDIGFHFGSKVAALDRAEQVGVGEVEVESDSGPSQIHYDSKLAADEKNLSMVKDPKDRLFFVMLRKLDNPRRDLRSVIDGMTIAEAKETLSQYESMPDSNKFKDRVARADAKIKHRVLVNGSVFGEYESRADADRVAARKKRDLAKPLAVYLNIKNPIRLKDLGVWPAQEIAREAGFTGEELRRVQYANGDASQQEIVKEILIGKGYDGIVYENEVEDRGRDSYIAFSPTQIKSAISNTGAFSPNDPRIQYSRNLFKPVDPDSPALKRWQGASKITAPVYHGSPEQFWTFDRNRVGKKAASPGAGLGFFFAADKAESQGYAGPSGEARSFYVKIENPKRMNSFDLPKFRGVDEAQAYAKRQQLAGFDGIVLEDEGHVIVFEPNQVKSAEINTGAFDAANEDTRYSKRDTGPVSLENLEAAAVDMGKAIKKGSIRFIKSAKKDSTFLERMLSTPEYYFKKKNANGEYGASARVLQAALLRRDVRHEKQQEILGDFVEHVKQLRKTNKAAYTEANSYLIETDQEDNGFSMKFDGAEWVVLGRDKKKVESYEDEQSATAGMLDAESEALREEGYSIEAIEAVRKARELTNRAFDIMAADMRRIIDEAKANGLPDPYVTDSKQLDEAGRYGIYAAGQKTPVALFPSEEEAMERLASVSELVSYAVTSRDGKVKNFNSMLKAKAWAAKRGGKVDRTKRFGNLTVKRRTDQEMRPMTIKEALAKMGDLRGSYFPRIRESGEYVLKARKDGENPFRQSFDLPGVGDGNLLQGVLNSVTPIGRKAKELKEQGYEVTIERDSKPTDDVFDATKLITSLDAILQEGMGLIDKNDSDEVRASRHIDQILTMQIADIFKARGYLASRMQRLQGDEVWEGYETDMSKALVQYGKNIAAGTAKRDTAREMVMAFTGRDYTWQQYKDEVEDPKWEEYKKIVEERRIDPGLEKNLFKDVRGFIVDVLRNDEQSDRIIGTMKGLAVHKFLGFRLSSAAVNATNMVTGVVGTLSGHTGESITSSLRRVTGAAVAYGKYRSNMGDLSQADRELFQEISNRGWDEAQFDHEAMSELRSKLGEAWNKYSMWSMFMFSAVERANRAMSIFAAYKGVAAKNPGWNTEAGREKIWEAAKEISDRAHGVYGKETLPAIARGGDLNRALRLPLTFTKFTHNYMLNILDLGFNKKEYKAAAYLILSPAILAGSGATLAAPVLFALAGALGMGGDDPEEAFYDWMAETFGSDAFARHGLAGVAGINIKGSLEMNVPMPTDIAKLKLADLGGPSGGAIADVVKGAGNLAKGDISKGVELLLPTAFGNMLKSARESREGITTGNYGSVFYGNEPLKADATDAIIRFLSFNPSRLSGIREKQWNEKEVAAKYQERRNKINSAIKRDYLQGKPPLNPERLKEIKRYNEMVRGSGRRDIRPMTIESIRTTLRRAIRPNKTERIRAAEMAN